ncbi:MAG: FeoB-associated Cys-rich membrane protein [bacterium]
MLESIVVAAIVIVAAFLVGRSFYRTITEGECSCTAVGDCSGCDFKTFEKFSQPDTDSASQTKNPKGEEAEKEF